MMAVLSKLKIYRCDHCEYEIGTPFHLFRHFLRRHTRMTNKLVCNDCDMAMTDASHLWRHISRRQHIGQSAASQIACDHCSRSFKCDQRSSLFWHYVRHHSNITLLGVSCAECTVTVNDKKDLLKHAWRYHLNVSRVGLCFKCGRVFATKASLLAHRRAHVRSRTKVCDECGRKYRQEGATLQLAQHIATVHQTAAKDGSKVKICDECDMKCYLSLWQHIYSCHMIRNSDSTIVCADCGQQINGRKDKMARHWRNCHSTNAPVIQCDQCLWETKETELLVGHIKRRHRPPRQFRCDKCDAVYYGINALFSHIKRVHQLVRVVCDNCDKCCSLRKSLMTHTVNCR